VRYRDPIVGPEHSFIAVSQSGETADTLAALKEAKRRGARILAVCNVIDSAIARDGRRSTTPTPAPRSASPATKAFMTQMLALLHLLYLGRRRRLGRLDPARPLRAWKPQPPARGARATRPRSRPSPSTSMHADFLYLGRGIGFPIALEGALKLKEISYIHAEGYAAGEMKHGPIALIDEDMPVVVVSPKGPHYDKTALQPAGGARPPEGRVIALATRATNRSPASPTM
jgi:glucosamine--fructose-6-phosphate aminotransferase (isomerizing)